MKGIQFCNFQLLKINVYKANPGTFRSALVGVVRWNFFQPLFYTCLQAINIECVYYDRDKTNNVTVHVLHVMYEFLRVNSMTDVSGEPAGLSI